jgi:hypothetical protein
VPHLKVPMKPEEGMRYIPCSYHVSLWSIEYGVKVIDMGVMHAGVLFYAASAISAYSLFGLNSMIMYEVRNAQILWSTYSKCRRASHEICSCLSPFTTSWIQNDIHHDLSTHDYLVGIGSPRVREIDGLKLWSSTYHTPVRCTAPQRRSCRQGGAVSIDDMH